MARFSPALFAAVLAIALPVRGADDPAAVPQLLPPSDAPPSGAASEPVASGASLRDALALMTARHTDRLPVVDAEGRPVGAVALADLVR